MASPLRSPAVVTAFITLCMLNGCTSPTPPAAPPSATPGAAADAGPLGPATDLMSQGKYSEASAWLQKYAADHPQDATARLLQENASADQPGKPIVKVGLVVSAGTLKGDEELRSAWLAEQAINTQGGIGGAVLNVIPAGRGAIYHMPADVVAALADDEMVGEALGSGIPFISLAPQDPAIKAVSFTPAAAAQWRATTAFLYRKVKGKLLVLVQKGQEPPSGIEWSRDNFSSDLRMTGGPLDVGQYAAVIIATPWSGAPAAIASLTHTGTIPIWICDLLGQIPGPPDSKPASPIPVNTAAPSAGLPDGVMVASEFAANEKAPGEYAFAQAFGTAFDHRHPGPWGWRTWNGLLQLKTLMGAAPTRATVRAALVSAPPPAEPTRWYLLQMKGGSWQYLRTYDIPKT